MGAALILLLLAAASGCVRLPATAVPAREDQAEVFVYLESFPEDSGRLGFTLDRLSAVGADGREVALSLLVREFSAAVMKRQRLIARGLLPPGQYQGLSYGVQKATFRGEEGEAALLLPEGALTADHSFEAGEKRIVTLTLTFRYNESIQGGFSFTPDFSLGIPALPASGLMAFTVNTGDDSLAVFNKRSGQVASLVRAGREPSGIAFDRARSRIYVSIAGEDAVDVFDAKSTIAIQRMNLRPGDVPRELALTPDGTVLLALNAAARFISIMDPVSLAEIERLETGEDPRSLVIAPAGNRAYVLNRAAGTLSVIDIPNRAIVAGAIPTEARPLMARFNRKGDRLYIVHEGSPYLTVFDPASLAMVRRVYVGPGLSVIKVDPVNDLIYAYRTGDQRVEVYDPVSLVPVDYLPAARGIVYMTIDSEEKNLYLVSAETGRILAVSLVSRKIVAETDVGASPSRVTMMGER
jgi:hypothetical protein